jgi:hypothetical protein
VVEDGCRPGRGATVVRHVVEDGAQRKDRPHGAALRPGRRRHQASDAVARAERLTDLQQTCRTELTGDRSNAIHLVDLLLANPVVTTSRASRELGVTGAGALNLIRRLEGKGWLRETKVSGRGGRITWIAADIMGVLAGALTDELVGRPDGR